MLTEYLRDGLFTVAWFGLMTMVWLGWSQEDPPARWRVWLGVGSALGTALAVAFGILTVLNWTSPTALVGRYAWFGALVGLELALAGAGCGYLAMRRRSRWMAWWVALVVAAHFLPLAWLLADPSIAGMGAIQVVLLALLYPRLRRSDLTTSRTVGPVMGSTLLAYALIAGAGMGVTTLG